MQDEKIRSMVSVDRTLFDSASLYNRIPAGLIKGARLSRVSDSAIKIGVGYGENNGAYWEITSADPLVTIGYILTGLTTTANGNFSIYLY
jgi:hypothetical protein